MSCTCRAAVWPRGLTRLRTHADADVLAQGAPRRVCDNAGARAHAADVRGARSHVHAAQGRQLQGRHRRDAAHAPAQQQHRCAPPPAPPCHSSPSLPFVCCPRPGFELQLWITSNRDLGREGYAGAGEQGRQAHRYKSVPQACYE